MSTKKTITSIFIIPTLIDRDKLIDNNFINGYVIDHRRDVQYEDAVYALFKPENIERFREFLEIEYETNHSLIDDYDYEEGFVVLVYKLPSKYHKDYQLIREGQYSKTSKAFQETFPKVLKIMVGGRHRDELSLQIRIFKKSNDIREMWEELIGENISEDMEVWPGWNIDKETLYLDKVKEELYENA